MKYKLLVLDIDGTLLNNRKEISPRTQAALLKAQQMGVHIVLASGRPTNGVIPIAEKLELNHYGGYILSYNGGQIINMQTGELLFEKRIAPEWLPLFREEKQKRNGFGHLHLSQRFHPDGQTGQQICHSGSQAEQHANSQCRQFRRSRRFRTLQMYAGERQ